MSDVAAFQAMAANVVALVGTGNSATDTAALSSIQSKLDALLASASSTSTQTPRNSTPSVATVTRIAAIAGRKQRIGMNATTGRLLTGVDHLKQSIADILHTRIGSRVMRRTYGSNLFERIDQPQNDLTRVGIIADIAEALEKWEPRFKLKQVKLTGTTEEQSNGKLFCTLSGDYNGAEISVGVAA
jgi:hypothetical protein